MIEIASNLKMTKIPLNDQNTHFYNFWLFWSFFRFRGYFGFFISLRGVGGGFLRVATCLWRCDFARPGFVLGKSTRNLTLGRINQWLPVYFWVYKINKTQSLRIMIIVEINNMISMIALIKWWVYMLLLCILSNVQY